MSTPRQAVAAPKTFTQRLLDGVERVGNKVPHPAVIFQWSLTYTLVFVRVLSSLAADAGYVVLIPLAAAAFISVGRHPLAGLAAGFAAVAGVFLVNVFIVPIDALLTAITNDAIQFVDPNRNISLTANFWFSSASVIVMGIVVALLTDRVIEPRLGRYEGEHPVESAAMSAEEARGLRFAFWALVAVIVFIALMVAPPGAPCAIPRRAPSSGTRPS